MSNTRSLPHLVVPGQDVLGPHAGSQSGKRAPRGGCVGTWGRGTIRHQQNTKSNTSKILVATFKKGLLPDILMEAQQMASRRKLSGGGKGFASVSKRQRDEEKQTEALISELHSKEVEQESHQHHSGEFYSPPHKLELRSCFAACSDPLSKPDPPRDTFRWQKQMRKSRKKSCRAQQQRGGERSHMTVALKQEHYSQTRPRATGTNVL